MSGYDALRNGAKAGQKCVDLRLPTTKDTVQNESSLLG